MTHLVHIVHLVSQVHLVATEVDLSREVLHLGGVWQGGTEHLVSDSATTAQRLHQRVFWVQSVQRCHVFLTNKRRFGNGSVVKADF